MFIVWRIVWRGKEWDVRWQGGVLSGGPAAEAFGRFVVSNAPQTATPPDTRLTDPLTLRTLMPQFADRVVFEQIGE